MGTCHMLFDEPRKRMLFLGKAGRMLWGAEDTAKISPKDVRALLYDVAEAEAIVQWMGGTKSVLLMSEHRYFDDGPHLDERGGWDPTWAEEDVYDLPLDPTLPWWEHTADGCGRLTLGDEVLGQVDYDEARRVWTWHFGGESGTADDFDDAACAIVMRWRAGHPTDTRASETDTSEPIGTDSDRDEDAATTGQKVGESGAEDRDH